MVRRIFKQTLVFIAIDFWDLHDFTGMTKKVFKKASDSLLLENTLLLMLLRFPTLGCSRKT